MNFFNTFRGRLLVILTFLLITTLGFQFYLNYRTQEENNEIREAQEQALRAGFALGVNSITSSEYLRDFVKREGQTFFNPEIIERIQDVIVINNEWQVHDSLSDEYLPTTGDDGQIIRVNLNDIKGLPPLTEGTRLGEDLQKFPNSLKSESNDVEGEAHVVPIETSDGKYYIMVILKSEKSETALRAAAPLVYTLLVLLFSTLITFILVWRFTRPIANLSKAAGQVAAGDLSVRVSDSERTDEMGKLTAQFNEMTSQLEKSRELESQLQEAEKSAVVGRLASAIAHEIRNPLNYINLTLDHLRNKFKPEDAQREEKFDKLTAQLKTEVERINRQISDFLRYSRPHSLDIKQIEVRDVIKESLRIVEPQAEDQNIKISVAERENVPKISGDAEMLRSVFSNLFINAVQAMEKDGGNLNVTIEPEKEFVKIEIKDTGGGIPEENLEKIFEPYFSTKETGTGLGLAIVKKIVDDHGGKIDVDSTLGESTVFTVKLLKAN